MEKHLLLTVADDVMSIFEADFIGSFFKNKEEIRVTLFSVAHKSYRERGAQNGVAGDTIVPETGPGTDEWRKRINLERERLLRLGFLDNHINGKVIGSRYGTIEDIILEGRKGSYDAVILGRHAVGLLDQTFSTSVSREILNHKLDFPVWVCKHPETGRRNVLLCVDEDEASMRVADHVGFVLQQEIQHNVTLFHVHSGERSNAQHILEHARQRLTNYGISDARIKSLTVQSHWVIDSIREEAESGAYAAIAVGHDRAPSNGLMEWLVGSRCMKILEMLNRCALWVSQ